MLKNITFQVAGKEIILTDSEALELYQDLRPLYEARKDEIVGPVLGQSRPRVMTPPDIEVDDFNPRHG